MTASPIVAARVDVESRFLEGLADRERKSVLAAASYRRFFAHSVMLNQGDTACWLFLLTRGRARYFFITPEGQKIILSWLVPGDIFGGAALLSTPFCYLVSAEAVQDCSVLAWDRTAIRDLAERYPRLLDNALSIATTDYLTWYLAAHVALTCHSARQRLANILVNLAAGIGRKVATGVDLDVSNEELASAANLTPFTVSRLLSEWQRNGAIRKTRGRIVLRSPEQLFLHSA